MSSYQYDVVVVGAGPSGSMTARYAAAGGCKTLLRDDGWVRGVHAKRLEEEMNIEAKCVVAADGYESQVGRWAGFKTLLKAGDITGTLQYRLTNIGPGHDFPDYCEFWLGTIAPA